MPDEWTIAGEAGKAINATVRTLPALRIQGLMVNFESLADDTMVWDVWLKNESEINTYVPEWGQKMSLFLNGDRYFIGHVTGRQPRFSAGRWGYTITVSGPWYFLREISIQSETADQSGTAAQRAMFLFPTGSVTDHLATLLSAAIDAGVPVQIGSLATSFAVPRLSLREMSFGEAIAELMRWLADGLVFIDYSGSGAPSVVMQRRPTASTLTIDPEDLATAELSVKPRIDLQVSSVSIKFAKRATVDNKRVSLYDVFETEPASTPLPSRQIITSTGPELDTWLPADFTDSVVVQSSPFMGNLGRALSQWHDLLAAGGINNLAVYSSALSDTAVGITTHWPKDPLIIITDSEGNPVDTDDFPYYLTQGDIREWFAKDGIESVRARVTATVAESVVQATTAEAPEMPQWARIVGARTTSHFVIDNDLLAVRYVWQASVSTVVPLVKRLWNSPTTLIRKEDWGWLNPPADLAENLLATQNWLPYEGTIPLATDEIPLENPVGSALNVANWVPETAAMRAMISGATIRPATGQITYRIGAPARHSYRDLVNRFRQSGADNIFWFGEEGTGTAPGEGPAIDYSFEDPSVPPPELTPNTVLHEDGSVEIDEAGDPSIDES
jgi:hypothetical protein